MYNRRVFSVDQLWQRVKFYIIAAASDGTTRHFVQLFLRYVCCYLLGAGHPNHPFVRGCGLVSTQVFDREVEDPLASSQLLLLVATESDLIPIEHHWSITGNMTSF